MCQIIAYYRVSTARQGKSGLGLDAQKSAVESYAASVGNEIIKAFTEVESGKNNNRPKLKEALELCELTGARLVIAKLDRLARNLNFISNLMESGVKFTAVDMPEANELTIHIMGAMAEHERKMISQRTKEGLKISKARGVKLGNPRIAEARAQRKAGNDMSMATAVRMKASNERAVKVVRFIDMVKEAGAVTLQQVANYLNNNTEIRTPMGAMWTRAAISRVVMKANSVLCKTN